MILLRFEDPRIQDIIPKCRGVVPVQLNLAEGEFRAWEAVREPPRQIN